MNRKCLSILFPALCIALGGCALSAFRGWKEARETPPITFGGSGVDLGRLKEGEIAKGAFLIRNTSDRPLSLEPIESTCGCTLGTTPAVLEAHGEAFVTVRFDSKFNPGAIRQFVFVKAKGFPNKRLVIPVTGTVVPASGAQPAKSSPPPSDIGCYST